VIFQAPLGVGCVVMTGFSPLYFVFALYRGRLNRTCLMLATAFPATQPWICG
jgi:hypothetical protein